MTTKSLSLSSQAVNTSPFYSRELRRFTVTALVTLFATILLVVYLMPFGNMLSVSVRSQEQLSQTQDSSIFPLAAEVFNYEGQDYPVYKVPLETGIKELALVQKTRQKDQFVDPENPDGGFIPWDGNVEAIPDKTYNYKGENYPVYKVPLEGGEKELALVKKAPANKFVDPANAEAGLIDWVGNWRTLESVQVFSPHPENFLEAWRKMDFPHVFANTLIIAISGMIGTLLSCIAVAYAFARFPIPGKNILFIVLIGTIILPSQVTLIPTYAFWAAIQNTNLGTGSWGPLIIPHFFANAYNVFLLRQYFMTLPRELDEAAMIDGAGPFRILVDVILPQSWPAIIAVGVFHFVFAWNDFFTPLIYLLGKDDMQPISVKVQQFNFIYGPQPHLVQATSLLAMILPLLIFFAAQKFFMRGVVITGVEK